ncbi:MAG: lipopolysaccharide kinase InaA family protein [Planctomycetota bacterium]
MNQRQVLARSRTVLVEKLPLEDAREVVRKTYSFPTRRDRFRGMFRGTLCGWNKAHREYQGLRFLELANIPVVQAISWNCQRNAFGFVTACSLTTRFYPGEDLAQRLKQGANPSLECWRSIGESIRKMHDSGFWHRGCSARNVMIAVGDQDIAWLDTSKSITYPAGRIPNPKRGFDLLRFWTPILNHTTEASQSAFAVGYGEEVHLEKWWSLIPNRKRASFRRELQREEARFEGPGSRSDREPI